MCTLDPTQISNQGPKVLIMNKCAKIGIIGFKVLKKSRPKWKLKYISPSKKYNLQKIL
jgi:hypothetical protein